MNSSHSIAILAALLVASSTALASPSTAPTPTASEQGRDARRTLAARALKSALEQAEPLRKDGKAAEATQWLERAVQDAFAIVGPEGESGHSLAALVEEAKKRAPDKPTDDGLADRVQLAVVALEFQPTMEAPLPKDFPPPGEAGIVMVKKYPAYRVARTPMGKQASQNEAFGTLFRHIQSNQISMTAPVEMSYAAPAATDKLEPRAMAFLYGSPAIGSAGVDAKSPQVEVVDVPAMTVVSIGVRGNYTQERMNEAMRTINAFLEKNAAKYVRAAEPRYLGYNSPFILPWRRFGEVQVPITEK